MSVFNLIYRGVKNSALCACEWASWDNPHEIFFSCSFEVSGSFESTYSRSCLSIIKL